MQSCEKTCQSRKIARKKILKLSRSVNRVQPVFLLGAKISHHLVTKKRGAANPTEDFLGKNGTQSRHILR
jgi:hypothetical protein